MPFFRQTQYQVKTEPVQVTAPAVNIGWFSPLGEPRNPKIAKLAAVCLMASGLFGPVTPEGDCVFQFDSFQVEGPEAFQGCPQIWDSRPWSEPVRKDRFGAVRAATSGATTLPPNPIVSFSWYQRLSEPVRVKARVSSQPDLAWNNFTPVNLSWWQPWRKPVRPKISVASHQSFTWGYFTPTATSEDQWHQPWSEPVRTRILPTAQQQALAWAVFTPEAVTDIRWFAPLSEPVRLKPGLRAEQQVFFTTDPDPVVTFGWVYGLSEPVKTRTLPTALRPALAWSTFTPAAQDIRWFAPLSEPVRTRWMAASQRPFFAADAKPAVSYGWFSRLSEPVRQKAGVHVSRQPFIWPSPRPVVSISWFDRLSEPVRQKPGLRASLQQPLALVKAAPFPETVTESRWHQPWSEPVRYRRFHAAYQQAQIESPVVTVTAITISLDVTESGDVFTGRLTIGFCPQADVSIVEIVAKEADVATAYVQSVFAEVGIIEIVPEEADVGTVYVPAVFAEVSITEGLTRFCAFQYNAFQIQNQRAFQGCLYVVYVEVSIIETC